VLDCFHGPGQTAHDANWADWADSCASPDAKGLIFAGKPMRSARGFNVAAGFLVDWGELICCGFHFELLFLASLRV
jgi:hypothetical protein